MPEQLPLGSANCSAVNLTSDGGRLDFMDALRPAERVDTVFAFTELESPSDAVTPIRFAADWWSSITVNSETVFDDESTQFEDAILRLCRVSLPLRKGKNLIGWAVRRHFNHPNWNLSVGRSESLRDEVSGKQAEFQFASVYRGPILLAFDHRFNSMDAGHVPGLDARSLQFDAVCGEPASLEAWLVLKCRDVNGQPLQLCDFASAGVTGNPYRTWFNIRGVKPVEFTRANPLRSMRPI